MTGSATNSPNWLADSAETCTWRRVKAEHGTTSVCKGDCSKLDTLKDTIDVHNWPWLLTLSPSHHTFCAPLQIRSQIAMHATLKTSFISTDMILQNRFMTGLSIELFIKNMALTQHIWKWKCAANIKIQQKDMWLPNKTNYQHQIQLFGEFKDIDSI